MTVKELIAKLQELPQDVEVLVNLGKNELANGETAAQVEVIHCYRVVWEGIKGAWYGDYYQEYLSPQEDMEYKEAVNISS